jgi:hypothetical protein
MATQDKLFKSYRDTKGSEATNKWVEEQRALGNPKILDKRAWYQKNKVDIKLDQLDKKMDMILAKITK